MTPSNTVRELRAEDLGRGVTMLLALAIVFAGYWVALPVIQSLLLPRIETGPVGPWLIRPILAFHFVASGILSAVTMPLVMVPLHRSWRRKDAELGSRFDPLHGRPLRRLLLLVKAIVLMLVYAAGLVFYLFSWSVVGPNGIQQRLPWGVRNHSFDAIESLSTIPDGWRSETLRQNGPWYEINFRDGGSITLSTDNEGITHEDLIAIASHVSKQSGLDWVQRSDTRKRR